MRIASVSISRSIITGMCAVVASMLAQTPATLAAAGDTTTPVQVVVDMDLQTPGYQSAVQVRACQNLVQHVGVFIRDPIAARSFYSIGYIGGIDRGISFGHMFANNTVGTVTSLVATPATPANPQNTAFIEPAIFHSFTGPEIVYLEMGSEAPAIIAANPAAPVFTADISISDAHPGDSFRFYLLDYVTVWTFATHGAFSTQQPLNSLDTGGDAVPDQTLTTQGIDPDTGLASPPAAFLVDYIDGPVSGGGATIHIIPQLGDVNGDTFVNTDDLLAVIQAWGPCPATAPCPADQTGDGVVNIDDLLTVITHWGHC
jgi:Dockerin type I domain